jgi:hypothetical protein
VSPITNPKKFASTRRATGRGEAQAAPSMGPPPSPSQRVRYVSFFLLALIAPVAKFTRVEHLRVVPPFPLVVGNKKCEGGGGRKAMNLRTKMKEKGACSPWLCVLVLLIGRRRGTYSGVGVAMGGECRAAVHLGSLQSIGSQGNES